MKKLMVSGRLISLIFGFVLLGGLVAAVSASEKIIEDDNFTIMIQEFVGTTTKILHEHGEVTVHLATADSEIIMIYKNADGSGRFPKYLPMRLHFLRDDGSRTPGFAAYISQEEPAYKHPDFLNYDAWLLSSFTWANVMRSMFVILEIDGLFLLFVDNNDLIIVNPTESDIPAKSAKESVANESDLPVAPNLGTANQWAREYINQAFNSGLIPTSLQNNYTANITRAEFAALAVALYGAVTGNEISGRMMFNDTYDVNVQKMGALGVVQGVGGGYFAPNDTLTREQAAVMLARLAYAMGQPLPKSDPIFADNVQISPWAFDAVGQMQFVHIMGGVGGDVFAPHGDYTREQSIVTMLRMYDLLRFRPAYIGD